MDAAPAADGPLDALRAAVRDGVDRYRSLKDVPQARRLLGAAAISYIGDRFNMLALFALSFELGDGVLGVGGMFALLALPRLLIQAPAGALVDRFPGKRLLTLTQLVMALLASSFALLAIFPSLWLLYGLTLAMGVVRTVDIPAFEVRLMALTPRERRGTVNAVHMLALCLGDVIGPILGAAMLALTGATPLFIVNAATFLLAIAIIARLPSRIAAAPSEETAAETAHVAAGPATMGYRALLQRPDFRLYVGFLTASCVLFYATFPLFIERAHDLGLGDEGVGLFYTVLGIGAFVGGVLTGTGTYQTRQAIGIGVIAALVGAVALVGFGWAPVVILAIVALVLFGVVGDLQDVSIMTYYQNTLPESVLGRFTSVFLMCTGAGGLIGALAGPLLAEAIGAGPALTILAIPMLVIGVLYGVREGGLRFSLPPLAPLPEPEVAGHLFGNPIPAAPAITTQSALLPRLSRLM